MIYLIEVDPDLADIRAGGADGVAAGLAGGGGGQGEVGVVGAGAAPAPQAHHAAHAERLCAGAACSSGHRATLRGRHAGAVGAAGPRAGVVGEPDDAEDPLLGVSDLRPCRKLGQVS